jgi:hypothetical protein
MQLVLSRRTVLGFHLVFWKSTPNQTKLYEPVIYIYGNDSCPKKFFLGFLTNNMVTCQELIHKVGMSCPRYLLQGDSRWLCFIISLWEIRKRQNITVFYLFCWPYIWTFWYSMCQGLSGPCQKKTDGFGIIIFIKKKNKKNRQRMRKSQPNCPLCVNLTYWQNRNLW